MGRKKKQTKQDHRQVSQPPTDTSEATQEQPETFQDPDLAEVGSEHDEAGSSEGLNMLQLHVAKMVGPRSTVQLGWGETVNQHMLTVNYDSSLSRLCKAVGQDGYSYMAFPLGGLMRAAYSFPDNPDVEPIAPPPPISLPDVQFDHYLWETYITGTISPWIDVDDPDKRISKVSINGLYNELDHATYLGLRNVIIPLKRANCPNLLKILKHYLWTLAVEFKVSLVMPTKREELDDIDDMSPDLDIFNLWVHIRRMLKNFHSDRISVGLKLCQGRMDNEFVTPKCYDRWKGEPLSIFVITADTFTFQPHPLSLNSKLIEINQSHQNLLTELITAPESQRFLIMPDCQIWPIHRRQIADCLLPILNNTIRARLQPFEGANWDASLNDRLALPMETVWRNLTSADYDAMESDRNKYRLYKEAISVVLPKVANSGDLQSGIFIYILGAGRGGLVDAVIKVVKSLLSGTLHNVSIYAVEKNMHAVMALRYKNEALWYSKVKILEGDMRVIAQDPALPKADIIVSDLLGSLGCNELAPELWDCISPLIKSTTFCIPAMFENYLAPVCAPRVRDQLRDSFVSVFDQERAVSVRVNPETKCTEYSRPSNWYDHLFVTPLRRYYEAALPAKMFKFEFPAPLEGNPKEKHAVLRFPIVHSCEINGFAGHFIATLTASIRITNAARYRAEIGNCSRSWFLSFMPLREDLHIRGGTELVISVWRIVTEDGGWYEWEVEYTDFLTGDRKTTERQNHNGHSFFMPLPPPSAECGPSFDRGLGGVN